MHCIRETKSTAAAILQKKKTTMKALQMVSVAVCFFIFKGVAGYNECVSPQYVKLGSTGIIHCSFREDVFSVLWYNSTNFFHDVAFLSLKQTEKSGEGFISGEFDIYPNGSLIINNVSLKHEGMYTVIKLDTLTSRTVSYDISVSVIAQGFTPLPVIDNCKDASRICFQTFYPNSEISCTVKDARPAIPLSWMVRTVEGDRNISSPLETTSESHEYFTSRTVITDPFVYSEKITLLVCSASGPPGLLDKNQSLLLLQNSDETLTDVKPRQMFVERGLKVELNCIENHVAYFIWQVRRSSEVVFRNILYAVFVGNDFVHISEDDYMLQNSSSIVVNDIGARHEGTYRCISGNGFEDDVITYDLSVFVPPDPPYLVVDGCNNQQYCVLEVPVEGRLSCAAEGIRPLVELDFTETFEPSSNILEFYDKTINIKETGDKFNVLLTSKYRFHGATRTQISVECRVLQTNIPELHLSTKFDLLFLQVIETTSDEGVSSNKLIYWVIPMAMAVVLVFLLTCGLIAVKAQCRRRNRHMLNVDESATRIQDGDGTKEQSRMKFQTASEEDIPMIPTKVSSDYTEKTKAFISQLKAKYQDLYDAIQPIPYIRDKLYCVDMVFVEGGIEYLVAKDLLGKEGTWDKLSSYHNILDDDRVKSKRRIIEGEPGYGKSTLTLQLCYDWCNKIQQSYFKDTDVLILLRLRQLGGVSSIYRAIKQFLLPKDSKLTESDVADILSCSSSVLVILDGYDEYPDQDDDIDSDVIKIITRNMFQQSEVILTTRSSFLPKKYPPLTKRLKLTGFDSNARDQYIRKAVVGDDVEAAEKIKQRLKENPVLGDLCQVPLFFVMFAHMSHESKQLQKFNSVTSFFRYMISCFHSHMKNKMEDANVRKYDLFETDHKELDNLAFEGLSGKNQKLVWDKKDMCERLGQEFYDQYVRIGILVEENVLDISDDPSSTISEHIQYKTEVRFYHKLFCEWYAAHHLSEYAARDDVTFDEQETIKSLKDHYLKYVDPFDLQYVYRFTCGLSKSAAEKIIGYLKSRKDGNKFSILCILEISGKVEDELQDIKVLCSRDVTINVSDSLLLQRSTIQLLEIALAHDISISRVCLHNCYSTVNLTGGNHIQLKSNLSIPVLTTLNKLTIDTFKEGREITVKEFAGILQYSSKCLALKELWLKRCLLPQSVQAESTSVLSSRNVEVIWGLNGWYRLNLESRRWEHIQSYGDRRVLGVMTDTAYQREFYTCHSTDRQQARGLPFQFCSDNVYCCVGYDQDTMVSSFCFEAFVFFFIQMLPVPLALRCVVCTLGLSQTFYPQYILDPSQPISANLMIHKLVSDKED